MEGLGISTVSSASRSGKRFNGDTKLKGKQQVEPPTTYTVSKIDAGQAVLISDQIHCIEFPSILLPPGCTTGSVVSISCTRNHKEEQARNDEFWDLQDEILAAFGEVSPEPPRLRLRNVTQTSVTLEWDRLQLATSKLLSLTIWRNGQRLAAIPNPLNNTSTKVSGLDVDAPYSFHLIMRTTAGTYASQTIKTRTLTLADTSGIAVCFGAVEPPELLEEAKEALTHMRARWSSRIQIETTHFVCTHPSGPAPAVTPPSDSPKEAPDPGMEYRRAAQLSIPIVQPAWIMACLREKRMVPISAYTLDKAALSGGPSSSASLGKNASSRSQHAAQQPRDGPREPIQLQKPPPPKHASPEAATAAPLPDVAVQTAQDIESAAPAPAPAEAVQIPVAEDVSDVQQKETPQTPKTSEQEVPTETVIESVVPSADVAVKEAPAQNEKADIPVEAASTAQSPEKVVQPDIASDAVIDPTEPTHEAVTEPETQLEEASLASDSQKDAETTQEIPIEQEDDVAESFKSADERPEVVQTSAPAEEENEASATKLDNQEEPSNAAAVQEAKDDSTVEKKDDVEVNDNNESETMEEVKL